MLLPILVIFNERLLSNNTNVVKRATGRKVAVLPTEELTVALKLTREELLSDAL
jgi:hypothetical protein